MKQLFLFYWDSCVRSTQVSLMETDDVTSYFFFFFWMICNHKRKPAESAGDKKSDVLKKHKLTRWGVGDTHIIIHCWVPFARQTSPLTLFVAQSRARGDSSLRFHAAAAAAAAAAFNGVILSHRLVKRGNGDTPAQSHTFPLILTFR